MLRENEVLLNENREILKLGSHVLNYIDLSGGCNFAYPGGKWKQGDIFVYLCRENCRDSEEVQFLLKKMNVSFSEAKIDEGMLFIGLAKSHEVKPIIKTWAQEPQGSFIKTIFERNEIDITKDTRELCFAINGKKVTWELNGLKQAGVLISGKDITFSRGVYEESDDILKEMIVSERFEPFLVKEYMFGKHYKEIFPEPIAKVMESLKKQERRTR